MLIVDIHVCSPRTTTTLASRASGDSTSHYRLYGTTLVRCPARIRRKAPAALFICARGIPVSALR